MSRGSSSRLEVVIEMRAHGCVLTLEAVHSAYSHRGRQLCPQRVYLRVVRGNHEHVVKTYGAFFPGTVAVGGTDNLVDARLDRRYFFRARLGPSKVLDGSHARADEIGTIPSGQRLRSGCVVALKAPLVDGGRDKKQIAGCIRLLIGMNTPRSAATTRSPSTRYSRQERQLSPGCVPWIGWGSCIGSSTRTMLRAAWAMARMLASETCPASSTTRWSNTGMP